MLILLVTILIVIAVVWGCFWIIDSTGIPYPINMIAKVIIGLIGIIALLHKTGLLAGTGI